MNSELKEKINILYQKKGMSLRDIGDKLHISHETVRQSIPRKKMRRQRMSDKLIALIVKVFKETDSFQETADRLKLPSRQTVYRVVYKEGLI